MHSFVVTLESARVEHSFEACLVAKICGTFARLQIAKRQVIPNYSTKQTRFNPGDQRLGTY